MKIKQTKKKKKKKKKKRTEEEEKEEEKTNSVIAIAVGVQSFVSPISLFLAVGDSVLPFLIDYQWAHTIAAARRTLGCTSLHNKCYGLCSQKVRISPRSGTIVPSDLLSSQKGTLPVVHPMLHSCIDSPKDTVTLDLRDRLCLPCQPSLATTISI